MTVEMQFHCIVENVETEEIVCLHSEVTAGISCGIPTRKKCKVFFLPATPALHNNAIIIIVQPRYKEIHVYLCLFITKGYKLSYTTGLLHAWILACSEAYEFGQLGTGLSWFR